MTIALIIIIAISMGLMCFNFYQIGYYRGWNDADQYSKMYKRVHDYIMENYAKEQEG